jgi:hypothetical protein
MRSGLCASGLSDLSTLKRVTVLFCILGFLACFSALPCIAAEYTVGVQAGEAKANTAHNGAWRVDVSYNPTTHVVTFTLVRGPTGQQIWNGWTWTVQGTVTANPDVVSFNAQSAIPTNRDGTPAKTNEKPPRAADASDRLTFTGATLNTKDQVLTIETIKNQGITFNITDSSLVPRPKPQVRNGNTPFIVGETSSFLNFNALTKTLSITGSTIVGLPDLTDPLLGATVTYPDFNLTGFNAEADSYMFVNQSLLNGITIANTTTVFQNSAISALLYDVPENLFEFP